MTTTWLQPDSTARPDPHAGAATAAVIDERLPALDGVRGLAIVLVLLHHLAVLPALSLATVAGVNLGELGAAGVDLFFVLSGFLITGILLDNKGSGHYFRNFYARRTLRIFPLYYAVIVLALVVLPQLPHALFDRFRAPEQAWSYWLYLSNFSMALGSGFRHGVLDVTWSLAIEEQFYLVWPAVVLVLSRSGLMRLCALMLAGAIVLRTSMVLSGARWEATYLLTPCRWDGLVVGAIIATASRAYGIGCLVRPARWVAIACAVAFAGVLTHGLEYYRTPIGQAFGSTLIVGIFAALLVEVLAAREQSRLRSVMSWRWLRVFGTFSYALYLMHVPVFATLHQFVYRHAPDGAVAPGPMTSMAGQVVFAGLAIGVVLGLAWLSWHLFEKHFLGLKRYFRTQRPARLPAAEHVWRPTLEPVQHAVPEVAEVELEYCRESP